MPNPETDLDWMRLAVEEAHRCPPSLTAFSVGAVIVGADGTELARGHSRESDPVEHAEEAALAKLAVPAEPAATTGDTVDARLAGATIYSTLEPCSRRASRPRPCARLILDAGIRRVVLAWREPGLFVADARGAELLAEAGVEVVELPELADAALAPNRHLPLLNP